MKLTKCKDCGKEYSDNLDKCDACGCPTEYNTDAKNLRTDETENNINIEKTNNAVKKKPSFYKIASLLLLIGILITAVTIGVNQNKSTLQKWEYKVVAIYPSANNSRTGNGSESFNHITPSEATLNQLGNEGWELVTSYLEMETAYPNFGDSQYVTGIQPNVRPQSVVMVFRRSI